MDPSEGHVYISRDIVFDENVFPFSELHPNAGTRLRAEILLLPEFLQNPTSFGNANLHDRHDTNSIPNAVSSFVGSHGDAGKSPTRFGEELVASGPDLTCLPSRDFMCFPGGGSRPSAEPRADPSDSHRSAAGIFFYF